MSHTFRSLIKRGCEMVFQWLIRRGGGVDRNKYKNNIIKISTTTYTPGVVSMRSA